MTSRRRTTSNQRWNNVVYVNVEIYKVEQRRINVTYFHVDINNIRQYRNNIAIFHFEFYNLDQRQNNVVWVWPNANGWKQNPKNSRPTAYFWASDKNCQELNMLNSKFPQVFQKFIHFILHLIPRQIFGKPKTFLERETLSEKNYIKTF